MFKKSFKNSLVGTNDVKSNFINNMNQNLLIDV